MRFSLIFCLLAYCQAVVANVTNNTHSPNHNEIVVRCGDITSSYPCGKYGSCIDELCVCDDKHTTLDFDGQLPCEYKRKNQLAAFILHVIFGVVGGGHFYLELYVFATLKAILFNLGCFMMFLPVFFIADEGHSDDDCGFCFVDFFGYIVMGAVLLWYIMDIFVFLLSDINDGNGVALVTFI